MAADLSWGNRADMPDVIKTEPSPGSSRHRHFSTPSGCCALLHRSRASEPHLSKTSMLPFPTSFRWMCQFPQSIHPSQKGQNRAVPTCPLRAPYHLHFTHSCSSFRMEAENKAPHLTTFLKLTVLKNIFIQ